MINSGINNKRYIRKWHNFIMADGKTEIIGLIDEEIRETIKGEISYLSDIHAKIERLKKTLGLFEKYKKKKPETEEEIKEVMSILCFGNIAYCCGIEKNCPIRDVVLLIFGIEKQRYKVVKNTFGLSMLKEYTRV